MSKELPMSTGHCCEFFKLREGAAFGLIYGILIKNCGNCSKFSAGACSEWSKLIAKC